jgi:uncharacterized repeat protein (TIGR02543 family)
VGGDSDTYTVTLTDLGKEIMLEITSSVEFGAVISVVTAAVLDNATTYTVTVSGSYASTTGSGSYTAGVTVTINAGTRSNYSFNGWTVASGGVALANASSATTTFTMPANAVSVTANWTYNGGSSGGGYNPPSNPNSYFEGDSATETHKKGSKENLVHITQKDFSQHNGVVKVDGNTLTHGTHYKAESGSTKITLFADYLDTLSVGEHTLTVGFKDGTTSTAKFTIAEGEAEKPTPEPWVNPFEDVKSSDWFYGDVEYAYTNGLMVGTSANPMRFSPNAALTRGMVVTVLYRIAGSPDVSGLANPFNDVAADRWYTDAVIWAAANKIVSGYGNGKFGPDDNITREQMAVMIINYQKFSGKIPPDIVMDREFSDLNDISDWAKDSVNRLTMQGMISGKPGNLFDPAGEATRAEFAAMLHRFFEAIKDE